MENVIKSIHPSEIEKTLLSLLKEEKKENFVKASLFNLIIYTKEDERESYLMDLCKSLIKKFPCRILFFKETDCTGSALETTVSALKPDGDSGGGFFCEFIRFKLCKEDKHKVPYLIMPYLVPDLPVYLLFGNDPSQDDCLSSLHINQFAQRIIFDSECVEHMSTFSSYMTCLLKKDIDVGDLNWARFSPWRKLISKFFSTKEKLSTIANADTITIKYNTHATKSFFHNKIQASYLQAWLAQKLGWEFVSVLTENKNITISYRGKLKDHTILIVGDDPFATLPPGRITEITVNESESKANFQRDRSSPHLIKICFNTKDTCQLPLHYSLGKEGSGNSLTREIYHKGTNEEFSQVLEILSKWKPGVICS